MNAQSGNLAQRRAWFRCFPEGTLEFLLVTRVLAILLLAGLIVVRGSQRPAILIVLGTLVLIDYLLMLWWGIQLVTDLDELEAPGSANIDAARRRRLGTLLVAMLPSILVMLWLTPFQELAFADPVRREHMTGILKPAFGVGYLILLFFAYRRLASLQYGGKRWIILFLVPGLHFLAMHRLVAGWQQRVDGRLKAAHLKAEPAAGGTLLFADITWVLCMLVIGLLVVMSIQDEATWVVQWHTPAYFLAAATAAIFAIAQVALMENLQRRFLTALGVEPPK